MALGVRAVAIGRPVMYCLNQSELGGVDSVPGCFRRDTVDGSLYSGVESIG